VNTYTTQVQAAPDVSMDPAGGFVVVWHSLWQDGSYAGVFGRRFDAGGVALGDELRLASSTTGHQVFPRVAHGPDGGFVVVWATGAPSSSEYEIVARRFDPSGTGQGTEVQVNAFTTGYQFLPDITADSNGGYVVVWSSVGPDGGGEGAVGRRLDGAGAPVGGEFRLNRYTTGPQRRPSVAGGANGGFVAVWDSSGQDGDGSGVFGSVDCTRFYPLPPCRVADTRDPPGSPLAANSVRRFPVSGRCGIPGDARAVAFNVTAVSPTDLGNLRLYPAGQAAPLASVVNFQAGLTRAGHGLAPLGAGGQVDVLCDMPAGSTGSAHVVLDVAGYFKR
jgi:hypothetical protein